MKMNPDLNVHTRYMDKAFVYAQKAFLCNEVPVGAVLVDAQGNVIGRGYNKVERAKVQTAHAEVYAIEQACRKRKDWRLEGCWLYVTLEPCTMCMGLVRLSRLAGVVYGAESKLFSYRLDILDQLPLYNKNIIVIGGVKSEQSVALLKKFFKQKRM